MTIIRPTPRTSVIPLLENSKINSKKNDYEYRSGWSGQVMGQQYRLDASEAKNFLKAISKMPKAQQKQMLNELYQRSEQTSSTGTVALDKASAAILNKAAAKLGLEVKFDAGQTRPMHPIG